MFDSSAAFYGLKLQARCMSAQLGETETHKFLIGTHSARESNEVHLIEFDEDASAIVCEGVYNHPPEIESIAAHPRDSTMFFTCFKNEEKQGTATLWKMPGKSGGETPTEDKIELEEVLSLDSESSIRSVRWDTTEEADDTIVSLGKSELAVWNLDQGCSVVKKHTSCSSTLEGLSAGCWDPHHPNQFVSVNNKTIRAWDLHTASETVTIDNAHEQIIRDVDYNPNKPYHVVTGGDDRKIKFWDLRKPVKPLVTLTGHTHWIWNVKYNRFHDQLVVSCGSDASLMLWTIVSISSAPLGELEEMGGELDTDRLIGSLGEHEESVYSVEWSCCDAWIFASLSYDGRVIINQVPSAEKYKILL